MSTPLLPGLNTENQISITRRGVWQSEAQNTLGNLVKALKVTADSKSAITSIPDLWARPAMYEMVLFDKGHHLHNKYLSEWRGILALLALLDLRSLKKIGLESIDIPEHGNRNNNTLKFANVVNSLLPPEYKEFRDESVSSGHKIQIITYDDEPLALVWPSILFCPAVELDKRQDNSISWWKITGINDPVAILSDQEKALLKEWLQYLINDLPQHEKSGKLMQLLLDYQNDLNTDVEADKFSLGNGINITGSCHLLGKPIKCIIDSTKLLKNSNVLLQNQKDSNAKKLLVLTTDLDKKLNKKASDIIIAGNINFDAVRPSGGVLFPEKSIVSQLQSVNAELRLGEDLFTDKICVIESSDSLFPNAIEKLKSLELFGGRNKKILLPIKKELLDYLSPEYIAENFKIAYLDNGVDIKAELTIPISGFDSEGSYITIEKVYYASQGEIIEDLIVPLIQVWPNFVPDREEKWQAYFSYYNNLAYPSAFYAYPVTDDEVNTEEYVFYNDTRAVLSKCRTFPDKYVCEREYETSSGKKKEEIGLILLKVPKKNLSKGTNINAQIGIDFGTTNTVAFINIDGTPKRLNFENRLFPVTNSGAPVNEREELRRHFFTACSQPSDGATSMRTIFNKNERSAGNNTSNEFAIFPGVIYFLDGIENISEDRNYTNLIQGKDMKWFDGNDNHSSNAYNNCKYFLHQLALESLAEAVDAGASNVLFKYSYPKSFTRNNRNAMEELWIGINEYLKNVSNNVIITEPISQTESASMAEYFKTKGAVKTKGFVCFDIGGGSTDIAIWKDDGTKPKTQYSLLFAGNDILNDQLFRNRSVLERLRINNNDFDKALDELINIEDQSTFNLHLEAFLRYKEKQLFQNLTAAQANKEVELLVRNIAFSLSGLFYYVGLTIGHLKKSDDRCFLDIPNCYVGGNASKLLKWVGKAFEEFCAYSLLDGLDKMGISFENEGFVIDRSLEPKEEVARGLVCAQDMSRQVDNGATRRRRTNDDDSIIAGEVFSCNDDYNIIRLDSEKIHQGINVNRNLPYFRHFLDGFNKTVKDLGYQSYWQIKLSDRELIDISYKVNEIFDQQRNRDINLIKVEAPFIVTLKEVLKTL